jgi:hypothetical protein
MAKGNIYMPIPMADMDNQLPEKLGQRYLIEKDGQMVVPTWKELAESIEPTFGRPLEVLWTDGKKYVVLELDASFMMGEQKEISDLRKSAGVSDDDFQSAPYGRLIASEIRYFLSLLPDDNKKIYAP